MSDDPAADDPVSGVPAPDEPAPADPDVFVSWLSLELPDDPLIPLDGSLVELPVEPLDMPLALPEVSEDAPLPDVPALSPPPVPPLEAPWAIAMLDTASSAEATAALNNFVFIDRSPVVEETAIRLLQTQCLATQLQHSSARRKNRQEQRGRDEYLGGGGENLAALTARSRLCVARSRPRCDPASLASLSLLHAGGALNDRLGMRYNGFGEGNSVAHG